MQLMIRFTIPLLAGYCRDSRFRPFVNRDHSCRYDAIKDRETEIL